MDVTSVSGGVAALAQKGISTQNNAQRGGSEESSEKVDNAAEERAEGSQQVATSAGAKGAKVDIAV